MELWHVMNRGVDRRNIVSDDRDRKRFVADLYAMNDTRPVDSLNYHFSKSLNTGRVYEPERDRDRLVTVHAWCLMDNHYHALISEEVEDGVSQFLKKLNMGYAKYFNTRYERAGALFQGKTKRVHVRTDAHFLWILHYIHFNPLDMKKETALWRSQCVSDPKGTLSWLESYRWSSFRDYSNLPGVPEILSGSFMYEDRERYMSEAKQILTSAQIEAKHPLTLE